MSRQQPDKDDKDAEEGDSNEVSDPKPQVRLVNKQIREVRKVEVCEVLDIAVPDLRLCIGSVFVHNVCELPTRHLANHANHTSCTMLRDISD